MADTVTRLLAEPSGSALANALHSREPLLLRPKAARLVLRVARGMLPSKQALPAHASAAALTAVRTLARSDEWQSVLWGDSAALLRLHAIAPLELPPPLSAAQAELLCVLLGAALRRAPPRADDPGRAGSGAERLFNCLAQMPEASAGLARHANTSEHVCRMLHELLGCIAAPRGPCEPRGSPAAVRRRLAAAHWAHGCGLVSALAEEARRLRANGRADASPPDEALFEAARCAATLPLAPAATADAGRGPAAPGLASEWASKLADARESLVEDLAESRVLRYLVDTALGPPLAMVEGSRAEGSVGPAEVRVGAVEALHLLLRHEVATTRHACDTVSSLGHVARALYDAFPRFSAALSALARTRCAPDPALRCVGARPLLCLLELLETMLRTGCVGVALSAARLGMLRSAAELLLRPRGGGASSLLHTASLRVLTAALEVPSCAHVRYELIEARLCPETGGAGDGRGDSPAEGGGPRFIDALADGLSRARDDGLCAAHLRQLGGSVARAAELDVEIALLLRAHGATWRAVQAELDAEIRTLAFGAERGAGDVRCADQGDAERGVTGGWLQVDEVDTPEDPDGATLVEAEVACLAGASSIGGSAQAPVEQARAGAEFAEEGEAMDLSDAELLAQLAPPRARAESCS